MLRELLSLAGQSSGQPNFGWLGIIINSGVEAKAVLAVLSLMSCWSLETFTVEMDNSAAELIDYFAKKADR